MNTDRLKQVMEAAAKGLEAEAQALTLQARYTYSKVIEMACAGMLEAGVTLHTAAALANMGTEEDGDELSDDLINRMIAGTRLAGEHLLKLCDKFFESQIDEPRRPDPGSPSVGG